MRIIKAISNEEGNGSDVNAVELNDVGKGGQVKLKLTSSLTVVFRSSVDSVILKTDYSLQKRAILYPCGKVS